MVLTLLLVSILTFAFNIQPVEAEPRTWTVDDDGPADFHTIQEAINAANDGNRILVKNGAYHEHIVVNKTVSLIGEGNPTIDGDFSSNDMIQLVADDIYISGFIIQRTHRYGVSLSGVSGCEIEKINLIDTRYGIKLYDAEGNRIRKSIVEVTSVSEGLFCWSQGIDLQPFSNDNEVSANNITGLTFGIHVANANRNTINSNRICECSTAIWLEMGSYNLIFGNNITDSSGGHASGVRFGYEFSEGNYIGHNLLNGASIICDQFIRGSGNIIEHNRLQNAVYGIMLVQIDDFQRANLVRFNELHNCTYGIALCSYDIVCIGNTVFESEYALWVLSLGNCTYTKNVILNSKYALYVAECKNGVFSHNTILNSSYLLSGASPSGMLVLHHNNFIENSGGFDADMLQWDDGMLPNPEGNYWSDYDGQDDGSGIGRFGESRIEGDGVGDTDVPHHGLDWYPLMEPWTTTINATIYIVPNTLNLRAKPAYVSAFIELPEGYNVSDIDVSSILLNNTIAVDPDAPTAIGDYDDDGIPDLMVKFDRAEVASYILANVNMTKLHEERFMTMTLTITGKLNDGTVFQGSDTIRIMMPMPRGGGRRSFLK